MPHLCSLAAEFEAQLAIGFVEGTKDFSIPLAFEEEKKHAVAFVVVPIRAAVYSLPWRQPQQRTL